MQVLSHRLDANRLRRWLFFFIFKKLTDSWRLAKANLAREDAYNARRKALSEHYAGWSSFFSPYDFNYIAVNAAQKRLAIGGIATVREHNFSDVIAVEAKADNATITSHNNQYSAPTFIQDPYLRERALINAIQSPTTSINTIRQPSLIITINDTENPRREIQFFHSGTNAGVDPRNAEFEVSAKQADQIHGLLLIALHEQQTVASTGSPSHDATGQLKDLWDLKTAGALTDAEYEAQKAKLLSTT